LIKLCLKKGSVSSIGAIGNDIFGEFIEKELKKYNVITHLEKRNIFQTLILKHF